MRHDTCTYFLCVRKAVLYRYAPCRRLRLYYTLLRGKKEVNKGMERGERTRKKSVWGRRGGVLFRAKEEFSPSSFPTGGGDAGTFVRFATKSQKKSTKSGRKLS